MIPQIPSKINEAIESNSLVLFVGAGFSIPLGLPNWNQLIEGIIDEVATRDKSSIKSLLQLFKNNDLGPFETLDILLPYENTVRNYLEKRIQGDIDYSKVNLDLHKKLWQISTQIITPNYDEALEKSNPNSPSFTYENSSKISKLNILQEYIFKIHGSIENVSKCILFKKDYETLYNDKSAAIFELKTALAHKTILFIGFSFNDPYVTYVAQYIAEIYGGLKDKHYIITVEPKDWQASDIKAIEINSWSDLGSFLDELTKIKSSSQKTTPSIILNTPSLGIISTKNTLNLYPKPDNNLFTGRLKEKELFRNALNQYNLFAIEGLGGAGKTEFVAKCLEDIVEDKGRILWLDCNENSRFDVFIESAGYGEVLKGDNITQRAIFSGFKDLIDQDKKIIIWDNYQKITDPVFTAFIDFAEKHLRSSNIIFVAKEEVYVNGTTIYTIPILSLGDASYEYAVKLRDLQFRGISDNDLLQISEKTLGHALAIKLTLPLIAKGIKVSELFSNMEKFQNIREVEHLTTRIFDEVFNRASQTEQDLILKFSVYNHKVPREAIEYIFKDQKLSSVLVGLIDKFLITYEEGYYETHPLIRELSYNRLIDKISTHALAAKYYVSQRTLDLIPALEEKIHYHLIQSMQWDRVENEVNIHAVKYIFSGQIGLVTTLIEVLEKVGIHKPIFDILYGDIEEHRGRWELAKEYYEKASLQTDDEKAKAEGMIKAGEILYRKGSVKQALSYYEKAHIFSKKRGLKTEEGRAINDIGLVYLTFGNFEKAALLLNEALVIREEVKDRWGVAMTLSNLALLTKDQGKFEMAFEYEQRSFDILNHDNNKLGICRSLGSLGGILYEQDRLEEALGKYNQSLLLAKEIGQKQQVANCLGNIAIIDNDYKKFRKALDGHEQSLSISREIGDKEAEAASISNIGAVLADQGRYNDAISQYLSALALESEIGSRRSMSTGLGNIADAYQKQKKYSEAIKYYKGALKIAREVGRIRDASLLAYQISIIYSNNIYKDYSKALNYLMICLALETQIGIKDPITIRRIKLIRDTKLDKNKSDSILSQVFDGLENDLQSSIQIQDLLKRSLKFSIPTSKNSPCPCGSGKQYKRCHGKE